MTSPMAESLIFAPLGGSDRGEEVTRRLQQAIALGLLPDGMQLPSEAELAAQLGVSTVTLRAGLAELRRLGLLKTRRGRGGGSFVSATGRGSPRAHLSAFRDLDLDQLRDLRDYHAAIAGATAALAAERARTISVRRLSSLGAAVGEASERAALIRTESRFHIEIAAATRSVRLTQAELSVQAEVGPLLWIPGAEARTAADAAADHARIVEAIAAGNATAAREAAEQHAGAGLNHLIELRMQVHGTDG
jgi:DNA-binding FadR family transcriptional regulator